MQFRNSPARFGAIAQTLHWLTLVLVAGAWILGQVGEDLGGEGPRAPGLIAHTMIGLAVVLIFVIRAGWRLADPVPVPEPTAFGRWGEKLAAGVQHLLLLLLVAAPVAGIAYQFARGEPLLVFGLFEIASPLSMTREASRSVKEAHELLANALVFLALGHGALALFHHWVLRDRTLVRMLPGDR